MPSSSNNTAATTKPVSSRPVHLQVGRLETDEFERDVDDDGDAFSPKLEKSASMYSINKPLQPGQLPIANQA